MKKPRVISELLDRARQYLPVRSVKKIEKAYQYAVGAHLGQYRKSGDAYITHPVEVAFILAELEQDVPTLCAALLHDTIEDSGVTCSDIVTRFGDDVATLVDGVTKLGKIYFGTEEEAQAENLRKMFLAMAKDLRVVLIKLADRLHNMRTLKFVSEEQKMRVSRETREIFSPLAHRLGMWTLKWELEDLAFYYLQPEDFQRIKSLVASRREVRERYVENFLTQVRELLVQYKIQAEVRGRPKHFYSIYKKLSDQKLSYDDLYDVLGIRIIVNTIRECYEVMGMIHSSFKPIIGRFKDYLAVPKSNMYQSLHTAVIGPEGKPIEIQIRTWDMHQIAEFGIAAHWRYKEGKVHTKFDADFSWLRQIIDTPQGQEVTTYLQDLKVDLFIDEVFVFTPKGEIQVLPKGATPLDFAYKIHTEIGHRCVGAKVNHHIVPLDYELQNADQVEILVSKIANPKIAWANFVKTSHAKSKIKQWFRKQTNHDKLHRGRVELEKALLLAGYIAKDILVGENFHILAKKFQVIKIEDLLLQIAHGEVSTRTIVRYWEEWTKKRVDVDPHDSVARPIKLSKTAAVSTIEVMGEQNVALTLGKCCSPIPGDDIAGYITIGYGVTVHRVDCRNISQVSVADSPRVVSCNWLVADHSDIVYPVTLNLEAFDRFGLLKDIVNRITESKTNIRQIKTKTTRKSRLVAKAAITIDVRNVDHLNRLKAAISKIPDVYALYRTNG